MNGRILAKYEGVLIVTMDLNPNISIGFCGYTPVDPCKAKIAWRCQFATKVFLRQQLGCSGHDQKQNQYISSIHRYRSVVVYQGI